MITPLSIGVFVALGLWRYIYLDILVAFLEVPVNERRCSGVDQKLEEWWPKGGLAIGGCMLYPAPVNYHIWFIIISCTNLLINYMFILYLYSHSLPHSVWLGKMILLGFFREFTQQGGQLVEVPSLEVNHLVQCVTLNHFLSSEIFRFHLNFQGCNKRSERVGVWNYKFW